MQDSNVWWIGLQLWIYLLLRRTAARPGAAPCLRPFIYSLLTASVLASSARTPAVFSYLPEWRYAAADFEHIARHSSHIAFFSAEPALDGSGALDGLRDRVPGAGSAALRDARAAADAHGAKLLLCLGGNGRSGGFSGTARNPRRRASLVRNVVAAVKQLNLDGIDWNWEYPGASSPSSSSPLPLDPPANSAPLSLGNSSSTLRSTTGSEEHSRTTLFSSRPSGTRSQTSCATRSARCALKDSRRSGEAS